MPSMTDSLPRPAASEYNEYYAPYVALVPDGDIVATLGSQLAETLDVLAQFTREQEAYRYAEGKWNVREVICHLVDVERLFAFRALTMARQDGAELPGMDQNEWVTRSQAADRPLEALVAECKAVRQANVLLFASFSHETGARTGVASGFGFSVRSFPWMIAGHELWHRALIQRDYLGAGGEG